jgi:hypothetical protein
LKNQRELLIQADPMSDDNWPFPDPRVSGVQEHYERIQTFLDLACKSKEPVVIFRLQVASIYFARGIIELIFEAADKDQLNTSRDQLKKTLSEKLRWYNLIERIRIHDFHRFGLIPPNPNMNVLFQGGPIKLHAREGKAVYSIRSAGLKKTVTGDSSIKEQRPLISSDGRFHDDETNKYVTIEHILRDFLCDILPVIDEFKKDLKD